MRRRSKSDSKALAERALAEGRHDRALGLLEKAISNTNEPRTKASLYLELAGTYLLAGDEYLDLAAAAIDQAVRVSPACAGTPIERVLRAELALLTGEAGPETEELLQSLGNSRDRSVHFHAACSWLLLDEPELALLHIRRAQELQLPRHLLWRSWSLTGVALEQTGEFEQAAGAIRQAVALAPAGELQELERLALADCLLELGDPDSAATELAVIRHSELTRDEDQIFRMWLQGRSEQQLGNPGLAIQHYRQARLLSGTVAALPPGSPYDLYSLTMAEAQLLADVGNYAESLGVYSQALELAPPELAASTRHEYAVVLIEAGIPDEAGFELRLVAGDADYEWRAEALAELADLAFREGHNAEAERLAHEALAVKPVATAYLCLGSMAFEYFRLDEAVNWLEQAAQTATDGDPSWLAAQQLLADVYAQMGPDNADRLYLHAQAALRYTDARNDWYLPLRNHAETARRTLAGQRRLVN